VGKNRECEGKRKKTTGNKSTYKRGFEPGHGDLKPVIAVTGMSEAMLMQGEIYSMLLPINRD
jgi:hypothetical protein